MKKVTIGKMMLDFQGKPIPIDDEFMTYKEAFLQLIGSYNFNENGSNGKRNIIGRSLGMKIYQCKDAIIEIEDEEFKMLKEILKLKIFSCLIMGPLEEEIERAEKEGGK